MTTTETDVELAARLADTGGERLVELRARMWAAGAISWEVMDGGDMASHHFLTGELAGARPDDAVLSEEGVDDPRRFDVDRVWIIDPLDGTREFGEHGRLDWAVHVALWEGDRFAAGAVSLPALGRTFATDPAPVVPEFTHNRPRLVTSRSRPPHIAGVVASGARRRARAPRVGGGQGDGDHHGRRRHLRPRRWPVPVGLRCACGRGARRRVVRESHRRLSDRLQRSRRLAPRLRRLPHRTGRAGTRRHRRRVMPMPS
ncbi:MAG: inositol monophosphatase family protein [Ilumatobacteraceae bacterium]